MARLDRIKNAMLRAAISPMAVWEPITNTMSQAKTATTTVRSAVARLESTFSMPIFARMEVTPAKRADKNA